MEVEVDVVILDVLDVLTVAVVASVGSITTFVGQPEKVTSIATSVALSCKIFMHRILATTPAHCTC